MKISCIISKYPFSYAIAIPNEKGILVDGYKSSTGKERFGQGINMENRF